MRGFIILNMFRIYLRYRIYFVSVEYKRDLFLQIITFIQKDIKIEKVIKALEKNMISHTKSFQLLYVLYHIWKATLNYSLEIAKS
jgi:hypothetical protein